MKGIVFKETNLENLPRWQKGEKQKEGTIKWKEALGKIVPFTYGKVSGELKIVNYIPKNQSLVVEYKNDNYKIHTSDLIMCKIGKITKARTRDFKIEIGTHLKDDKRDLIVTDRKRDKDKTGIEQKYYKFKCQKCGFECGEHYNKYGELKSDYWMSESNLINCGRSCACCSSPSQITVPSINSIVITAPWMIPYFQGGYDEAKKYTHGSGSKIYPVCPDCGRIKPQKVFISNIYKRKGISCVCKDTVSFGEKAMYSVLEQLNESFEIQLTKATFEWCDKYRYDFYLHKNKIIIEINGGQHSDHSKIFKYDDSKTLEEEQENDKIKKQLALDNGIEPENYIPIDCLYDNLDHIKDNILKSRLSEIFDLSKIDWLKVEELAVKSTVKEICSLKRNNPEITVSEIAKTEKRGHKYVKECLVIGNRQGWCEYDPTKERKNKNCKKIIAIKDNVIIGEYNSIKECSEQIEESFGIKIDFRRIGEYCSGKRKPINDFSFILSK